MYTYSGTPAALDVSLTALQVHHLMKSPNLLARRFKKLVDEKFIADWLLTGRYPAIGGAIAYPAGELDIYPKDVPEAINPGGQYPLTQMDSGQLAIAKTTKRGIGTHVFDEEISRMLLNPVNDAFTFLGNAIVKQVDSIALAVIASRVTATYASGAWTGASAVRNIVTAVQQTKAQMHALKLGLDPDTIVLTEAQYQTAMAEFLLAGMLPREANNPLLSGGDWPTVLGLTWTTSPNVPFSDPFMIDRQQLGGMADEDIPTPEFHKVAGNVELASDRLQGRDGYEVRSRRACVPIVTRPAAGIRLTGTGL